MYHVKEAFYTLQGEAGQAGRAPRQALSLLPWRGITPERLADHLAAELMRCPTPRVRAFEGIDMGAIAEARP